MARKKRKVKKAARTGRTSSSKPNPSNTPKTEKTPQEERCKTIRHILSVIGKEVAAHLEATTNGKKHEHVNAAIVGSETLWQNLRALSREI